MRCRRPRLATAVDTAEPSAASCTRARVDRPRGVGLFGCAPVHPFPPSVRRRAPRLAPATTGMSAREGGAVFNCGRGRAQRQRDGQVTVTGACRGPLQHRVQPGPMSVCDCGVCVWGGCWGGAATRERRAHGGGAAPCATWAWPRGPAVMADARAVSRARVCVCLKNTNEKKSTSVHVAMCMCIVCLSHAQ